MGRLLSCKRIKPQQESPYFLFVLALERFNRWPNLAYLVSSVGMDGEISAFVLAGGKSSRMGTDKALVMLQGHSLLAIALDNARAVTPSVQIVGDRSKYETFGPVIEDIFPECGPLAGIHAALRASQTELNVILAVDVPFVSPALLEYVLSRARNSDAVVTVPCAGGLQPLCAVYRRAFADLAEKALRAGKNKIDALFDQTRVLMIPETDIQAAGFTLSNFRNLNTARELASATDPDTSRDSGRQRQI